MTKRNQENKIEDSLQVWLLLVNFVGKDNLCYKMKMLRSVIVL